MPNVKLVMNHPLSMEGATIKLKSLFSDAGEDHQLWRQMVINCKENVFFFSGTIKCFDVSGKILDGEISQDIKWYPIDKNSSMKIIKKHICRR